MTGTDDAKGIPVKIIAYYISDYGYGHASRSVAVIRALCRAGSGIKIIVCHAYALPFLAQSLSEQISTGQVQLRRLKNDVGYRLKLNSLEPDPYQLRRDVRAFIDNFSRLTDEEVRFLKESRVALVISDIPPVPFKAAAIASIPSVGISNFTWYTAYEGQLSEEERQPLLECYQQMDYFFALAGSTEGALGRKDNLSFGYFARTKQSDEVKRIRAQAGADTGKTIVFFGLGMKLELARLASLRIWDSPNCSFLVSSNIKIEGDNIFHIPNFYSESQNYVAASDLVISKPGWGLVAEAVSFHKPLILATRNQMREDRDTVSFLSRRGLAEKVSWNDLPDLKITGKRSGQWQVPVRSDREPSESTLARMVTAIYSILDDP